MAQNQNTFDFKAFNAMVREAGSGLKLHLALGLLKDVEYHMYCFDNPLHMDLRGTINGLVEIKEKGKVQAAERAKRVDLGNL